MIGISPPGFYDLTQISAFEAVTGIKPAVALVAFMDVADQWNGDRIAPFVSRGIAPQLTWTPIKATLVDISAGKWDSQIAQTARWSKGTGVQVRFGHEMNGNWVAYGQKPAAYIAAWKHARAVWRTQDTAAPWIWSPNITSVNSPDLASFYPGDGQCEFVGLDGYSYPKANSLSFHDIFDANLTILTTLSKKPQLICETGVDQAVPNRAAWITGMFAYLLDHPQIVGVSYWNRDQYAISDPATSVAFYLGASAWTTG